MSDVNGVGVYASADSELGKLESNKPARSRESGA